MHQTKIMGDCIKGGGVDSRTFLKASQLCLLEWPGYEMSIVVIGNPSLTNLEDFMAPACIEMIL